MGEALLAGHFPTLITGQCTHRSFVKALDAAGKCVADLVGFASQAQGHDDLVAGGALDQGHTCARPVLADDQLSFPVAQDSPISVVGALIDQTHSSNRRFAAACGGLAHLPARGQAYAVPDEGILGVGVDRRVNRLMADRMALGDRRSVQEEQCARRSGMQAPPDLAECLPLTQIRDQRRRRTSSQSNGRFLGRLLAAWAALPTSLAQNSPSGPVWRTISWHTTEGLHPIK